MNSSHLNTPMFQPVRLWSRVRVTWSESEWFQPAVVGLLIWLVLFGSIAAVFWSVW